MKRSEDWNARFAAEWRNKKTRIYSFIPKRRLL